MKLIEAADHTDAVADAPLSLRQDNVAAHGGWGKGLHGIRFHVGVGDVLISSVVHDEHSRSTYWLDNVFSVDDLAADLRFGTGLDNQRAVTVKIDVPAEPCLPRLLLPRGVHGRRDGGRAVLQRRL